MRGPSFTAQAAWVSACVSPGLGEAPPTQVTTDSLAASLRQRVVAAEIGGAFWAPDLVEGPAKLVLCPDGHAACDGLLAEALASYAAADVLLLAEGLPERQKQRARRLGLEVVASPVNPWSVLCRARALWVTRNNDLATLGILAGHAVRGTAETADQISMRLLDARYGDPRTGAVIDPDAAIDLLCEWRDIAKANQSIGCCIGISFWKRARIAAFLHDGTRPPAFVRSTDAACAMPRPGIAGWNARLPPDLAARAGGRLLRVEDGFIRSLGLGSGFLPPSSIVVDGRGIYYDPRQPSDLEHILAHTAFSDALCARATALIARLNQLGITKYATGGAAETITAPPGRHRILVPGQVADDLSVTLGGGTVRSNLALLESVRNANPTAWIVYKPHPDVEAGHRAGALAVADLQRCADQVVRGGAMSALIQQVDEVATMTSLAGFEALLRGRDVTVLGQPFYAGWGLTNDLHPLPRRQRRLSLAELAAGALILYPRYLDPVSTLPCGPELLLRRLEQPELWRPTRLMQLRALQGRMKKRLHVG